MAYGPTAAGWVGKSAQTIKSEFNAGWKGILGDSAGTEADGTIPDKSLAGQQIVILTDAFSGLWDLLQALNAALDPNSASDAQLDALSSLTGTTRDPDTFSTVTLTCTGTPLTVLNVGRKVKTSDTGVQFESTESKTITALTAWAALTLYAVDDRRTNSNRCYICITAGTSAGSGGPTTTAADITDGTAHWKYLGDGTGAVDAAYEASEAGPVGALAGALTEIATPVSGWNGVTNLLDAVVGQDEDTDPELRARREQELSGQGLSATDAIRAHVLKVNEGSADPLHQPPQTCTVFRNNTDGYDGNGLPPHSVEVLVQGGTDADIAQAVWEAVGAGTATFGNQTSTVVDSEGVNQTVNWSRPVEVDIYATATVLYDASRWPASSDARVAQAALSALLTYCESFAIGVDVRVLTLGAAIMRGPSETDSDGLAVVPATDGSAAAPGILDVTPIYIGTSAAPVTSTNIVIDSRHVAVFDSGRCVITATAVTP